ncbi:metacaspase-1-like [Panicum miliaceum]|uniref:Metacaspase-1-like n=1 Tax=Panicum miliaceum TaxID=4540 RepID=A0A3L6THB4_PANMI|nr:metacaspase-1-like [Panicum miliaceum]
MNCGGRTPATILCKYCSACLTVTPGERAIQCAQCCGVTRIRCSMRLPLPALPRPAAAFPCTRGKKRAVLIGITYAGMRRGCGELRGPINDVKCMRQLLCQRFGFPSDCIIMLTGKLPTKDNIRMAMQWLVQGCSYGDSLVFHFSGMGAQVPDEDCDEADGYDEAICPMDSFQKGPILDDEINEAIVRPLVHGAKLHAVVDACHSATVLDLPFFCNMSRSGNWQWQDHRPPSGACKGTNGGQAVLISGYSDGKSKFSVVGAMTHSFIKAVDCEPCGVTYGRLLTSMKAIMTNGGGSCNLQGPIGAPVRKVANFSGVQEPNLSSSEMFDIYRKPFAL